MTAKVELCESCGRQIELEEACVFQGKFVCEECNKKLRKQEPFVKGKIATTKKCPFCAEDIQIEALKCRFCGSEIDEQSPKRHEKELQKKKGEEQAKTVAGFLVLGVVVFFIFVCSGIFCNNSDTKKSEKPLEYMLATINKGGYVPENHVTVTRFRYLLDTLEQKTTNSKQEIADMSVAAVQELRDKYGVEVKLMDFMEAINKAIPAGSQVNYAEVSALYMQTLK